MTQALAIINRAYDLIGYKDPDEPLTGSDSQSGLDALNSMIDAWQGMPLYVYAVEYLVQTVSGDPITIGTGGTLNTERPVSIPNGGFVRAGGIDYGFTMIDREAWASISLKSLNTPWPSFCYYEPALPLGNLYFYPQMVDMELHLPLPKRVSQFDDLQTDYTLEKGYRIALEYSLAEELAPGKTTLEPIIVRKAAQYRKAIQRSEIPLLNSERGLLSTPYAGYSKALFNSGWMT